MMLNKELLQGELPTDASSTVSNIINQLDALIIHTLYCRSSPEFQRHKGRRKEK